MKLAIVGSTCLEGNADAERAVESVLDRYQPSVVVSGGAPGVDTIAEHAAIRRGIATEIYRPTRRAWKGPGGYEERNMKIAVACDQLVRIVSSLSTTYGSGWTRDKAKGMKKDTEEIVIVEWI